MGKLNKKLDVGKTQSIIVNGKNGRRKVTYKRVALKGFPQWKILKNEAVR
jgi:hypothetical protein